MQNKSWYLAYLQLSHWTSTMPQKLICVFLYTITRVQDACFMAPGYESAAGYLLQWSLGETMPRNTAYHFGSNWILERYQPFAEKSNEKMHCLSWGIMFTQNYVLKKYDSLDYHKRPNLKQTRLAHSKVLILLLLFMLQ